MSADIGAKSRSRHRDSGATSTRRSPRLFSRSSLGRKARLSTSTSSSLWVSTTGETRACARWQQSSLYSSRTVYGNSVLRRSRSILGRSLGIRGLYWKHWCCRIEGVRMRQMVHVPSLSFLPPNGYRTSAILSSIDSRSHGRTLSSARHYYPDPRWEGVLG